VVREAAVREIQWSAGLDSLRRQELRRVLIGSGLLHLAAVVVLSVSPTPPGRSVALPAVVSVDLVAALPGAAAPAPPKPKAAPKPKKVVLPKEPAAPKAKPKPAPKAKADPKPKPKPKAKAEPQKSYEDLLKEMRERAGEKPAKPAAKPTQVAGVAGASGAVRGVRVSPEEMAWRRTVRIRVRNAWVLAPGFRHQDLQAHVRVKLDASGNVVGVPKITRRSGNPWYDDSVLRALAKASPLPPPPEAGDWEFGFSPEDVF
jgi:TonB family protein